MSSRHRRARHNWRSKSERKLQWRQRREVIETMTLKLIRDCLETGDFTPVRRFATRDTIRRVVRQNWQYLPRPARDLYHHCRPRGV